jgi:hypothetical protein
MAPGIHRYPVELIDVLRLATGERVRVRPVKPDLPDCDKPELVASTYVQ